MDYTRHLDRVMALAGLYQATALVQQVARKGSVDSASFETSINSLFKVQADCTVDVYGGGQGIKCGLITLARQFSVDHNDAELTRYALTLLFLERKLMRRQDSLEDIITGVKCAIAQSEFFSAVHQNVVAKLADIYTTSISPIPPRIMVYGEPQYLSNPDNANRIRALLLAGIRSAVLWRQMNGNRLQLLLGRRQIVRSAEQLLATLC